MTKYGYTLKIVTKWMYEMMITIQLIVPSIYVKCYQRKRERERKKEKRR